MSRCSNYLCTVLFSNHCWREDGINRPELGILMQANTFADFSRRKRSEPIQFVFIVETAVYDRFRKQSFRGTNQESYKITNPRNKYPGRIHGVFGIDVRSVYLFYEAHKSDGVIDITKQKTLTKIRNQ